jgi:hypothetical protein
MIRKVALVGCKEGPWVSLAGMPEPHLRAVVRPGTRLRVEHLNGKVMGELTILKSGLHELFKGANFARVSVAAGDHESVLCDIISRRLPDDV